MASGTQSPPLESTGEHQPVGAASKAGEPLKEGVKDSVQRSAYFGGNKSDSNTGNIDASSGISAEAIADADRSARNVENKGH